MSEKTNACLSCLDTTELFSVFDNHECEGIGQIDPSAVMLKECFGIEVTSTSKYNTICGSCMLELRHSYLFKLRVIKNISDMQPVSLQLEYLADIHPNKEINDSDTENDITNVEFDSTGHIKYIVHTNDENNVIKIIEIQNQDGNVIEDNKHNENIMQLVDINNLINDLEIKTQDNIVEVGTEQDKHLQSVNKIIKEIVQHQDDKDNERDENRILQATKPLRVYKRANKTNKDVNARLNTQKEENNSKISNNHVLLNIHKEDSVDEGIVEISSDANNIQIANEIESLNEKITSKTGRKKGVRKQKQGKLFTLLPGQMICSICQQSFSSTNALQSHMMTHYTTHSTFVCEQCGARFATVEALKRHVNVHLKGPFLCTLCDKLFDKINSRNSHMWRVHNTAEPYACSECGRRFKTFHQRLNHLKQDHEKTEPQYPCPHCDKKFFYSGSRNSHIRLSHLGERRYKCTLCPMAFGKRRCVLSHLASIHNIGEKRYNCTKCAKSFYKSTTLKYHLKTHDKKKKE